MNVSVFFLCGMLAHRGCVVAHHGLHDHCRACRPSGEIGLVEFLFGTEWASTAAEPKFGILPFILTSIWGTLGAIAHRRARRPADGGVPFQSRRAPGGVPWCARPWSCWPASPAWCTAWWA